MLESSVNQSNRRVVWIGGERIVYGKLMVMLKNIPEVQWVLLEHLDTMKDLLI